MAGLAGLESVFVLHGRPRDELDDRVRRAGFAAAAAADGRQRRIGGATTT
jgi:hypothetical protein